MRATLPTIAIAGAVAAVLDILGAFAIAGSHGVGPVTVLQSVASGALGRESYRGGAATAVLGAVIHLGIATAFATVFVLAATRLRWLTDRWWIAGPIYGLGAWAVMYLIVLPIRWPAVFPRFSWRETAGQLFCHIALVGLSIAFVASRRLRAGATT